MRAKLLIAPLLMAFISSPASAWSDEGHEMMASMAYDGLTPTSKAWVDSLLTGGQYSESFISGSTWAKRAEKAAFFEDRYQYEQITGNECRDHCLLNRAVNAITTLKSATPGDAEIAPSYQEQQQALMNLVYYTGELHMPLNAGSQDDNYGKNVGDIKYLHTTTTLYDWWDSRFVNEVKNTLRADITSKESNSQLQPTRWLEESRSIAMNNVYGPRPRTNLSNEYVNKARNIVKERLTIAASRLAQIINQLPATQEAVSNSDAIPRSHE